VTLREPHALEVAALALAAVLASGGPARGQEPAPDATPTPTPVPTRLPTRRPVAVQPTSLADIVRKSQEEKAKEPKKKSLGVITNEQVKKAGDGKTKVTSGTPVPTATSVPVARFEVRDNKGRTEADWRRISAEAKTRVARGEARVMKLEEDARRLENDFYAWSDGNYRDRVIKPAWDQAREDLGKARHELEDARRAVDELEEEARRSDAPPGWLR